MKILYFYFLLFLMSSSAWGQSAVFGKVMDEKTEETLIYANIILEKDSVFAAGGTTDFDGNFYLPVAAGTYDLKLTYTGYPDLIRSGVVVKSDQKTELNLCMKEGINLTEVVVVDYKIPTIRKDHTMSGSTISSSDIRKLPSKALSARGAGTAGASTVRGSRAEAKAYYLDGIRISSTLIPESEITRTRSDRYLTGTEAADGDVDFTAPHTLDARGEPLKKVEEKKEKEISKQKITAGIITAGEWNGLKNWGYWKNLLDNQDKQHQITWSFFPNQRFKVELKNDLYIPLPNVRVQLINKNNTVVWQAVSDQNGKAELWGNIFATGAQDFKIQAFHENNRSTAKVAIPFQKDEVNKIILPVHCQDYLAADIFFAVDATGSMGDEIQYLKAELEDVIRRVQNNDKQLDIRTGSVFYRDRGDQYVTKVSPFSDDLSQTVVFIQKQNAKGGGDFPEAVHTALEVAMEQEWRAEALTRVLFLLLDAPPHNNPKTLASLQNSIEKAAQKGIRIVPITASGINKPTEFLMKSMAMATNGTYVFITDHSGVGNVHLEASVDEYEVELLNDLMERLIIEYTTQQDCSSAIFAHTDPSLDTSSSKMEDSTHSIKLFPNPAENFVNVQFDAAIYNLNILNINGQLIQSIRNLQSGTTSVDLSYFINGVYVLQFQKGKQIMNKKLVIAKQ